MTFHRTRSDVSVQRQSRRGIFLSTLLRQTRIHGLPKRRVVRYVHIRVYEIIQFLNINIIFKHNFFKHNLGNLHLGQTESLLFL